MKKIIMAFAIGLLSISATAQAPQKELWAADKVMQDMLNAFLIGMGDVVPQLETLNKAFYQTENRDSVEKLMAPLHRIYMERQSDYLQKYPGTALAAYFKCAGKSRMSVEQMKETYNSFDEIAKQTTPAKEMLKEITTLERVAPGNPAPEIARNDLLTGKPFSLSSLKGKVVLLDFWASWCKPCRASNPHVKALYDKYHKKGFDVVYVADNDKNPDEALKAIEQDGIKQYHHVLRGLKELKDANGQMTGFDRSQDVSENYAVHFLPTKYLIDREGNIIGKVNDTTLDEKLKDLFGF